VDGPKTVSDDSASRHARENDRGPRTGRYDASLDPSHPSRRARILRFVPGQRWQSLTEPELGLGVLEQVDGREVVVLYPARGVVRTYAADAAPLARARLAEGHEAAGRGVRFRVEEVVEGDVLRYRGEGQELLETDLDAALDVATPENRLRTGRVDDVASF